MISLILVTIITIPEYNTTAIEFIFLFLLQCEKPIACMNGTKLFAPLSREPRVRNRSGFFHFKLASSQVRRLIYSQAASSRGSAEVLQHFRGGGGCSHLADGKRFRVFLRSTPAAAYRRTLSANSV